jgi:hypothetical protein
MKTFGLTLATAILLAPLIGTWPSAARQANTPKSRHAFGEFSFDTRPHEGTRNNGADPDTGCCVHPFRWSL